jgi:hypothetical protein
MKYYVLLVAAVILKDRYAEKLLMKNVHAAL